jgi:hypothetical protein
MLPRTRVTWYHHYLDAKRHAPLMSNFVLENSLYSGVNDITSFQNLVGNLDKMIVANLIGNIIDF